MELEIYNFPSQIWKFIPTPNGQQIVVELRDKTTQSLHYQVIPSNISIPSEKGKYVGLAEVNDKIMLLHGYLRPEFPIRKGIWAHQLSDGKFAWEQTEMNFVCFDSNFEGIIVNLSAKPDIYLLLNADSGEILAENIALSSLEVNENQQHRYKKFSYSNHQILNTQKSHWEEKVFQFTQKEVFHQLEYIVAENHTFIVFYTKNSDKTEQYLLHLAPNSVRNCQCLNENVERLQAETMLAINHKLILLITDNQLAIINF